MKRRFRIAGLIVSAFLVSACSGNSASTPSSPEEIPGTTFNLPTPDAVTLDVSTITTASEGGAMLKAFVASGGSLAEDIAACANMAETTGMSIIDLLSKLEELSIPASLHETTFTGDIAFTDGSSHEIQILFSDFDLDGDGTSEGCSGNTKRLPLCYRIWIDGERYLAGVMDSPPTDSSAGKGRFRSGGETDEMLGGVAYDHPDSEHKTTSFFIREQTPDADGNMTLFFTIHGSVDQVGPDDSAIKTLKTASQGMGMPEDTSLEEALYVGQWQEGNDFWIGSLEMMGMSFENLCATISTAEPASSDNCSSLGIDVSGEDFYDFATEEDVGFPEDFSETP